MIAAALDAAIKAVCPIHGVTIGRPADKKTWSLHFKDEATPAQRAAAEAVLNAFDEKADYTPPPLRDLAAEIDTIKTRVAAVERK